MVCPRAKTTFRILLLNIRQKLSADKPIYVKQSNVCVLAKGRVKS